MSYRSEILLCHSCLKSSLITYFIQNAIVYKLQVILLITEGTEKSESSYYSLSYWGRLPIYSPCCSYRKVSEQHILTKCSKCNTFLIISVLVHDVMDFNALKIILRKIRPDTHTRESTCGLEHIRKMREKSMQ